MSFGNIEVLSVLINVNSRYLVVKVRNHFFKE